MNDRRSIDYIVKQNIEGKLKKKRLILVFIYIAATLGLGAIICLISPLVLCVLPILIWMLWFYTWRYTDIKYEYRIEKGELTFTTIIANSKKRENFRVAMNSLETVAPASDKEEVDAIAEFAPEITYDAKPSANAADNVYFALFTDKQGKKCIFWFEMTPPAIEVFKYFNAAALVTE